MRTLAILCCLVISMVAVCQSAGWSISSEFGVVKIDPLHLNYQTTALPQFGFGPTSIEYHDVSTYASGQLGVGVTYLSKKRIGFSVAGFFIGNATKKEHTSGNHIYNSWGRNYFIPLAREVFIQRHWLEALFILQTKQKKPTSPFLQIGAGLALSKYIEDTMTEQVLSIKDEGSVIDKTYKRTTLYRWSVPVDFKLLIPLGDNFTGGIGYELALETRPGPRTGYFMSLHYQLSSKS